MLIQANSRPTSALGPEYYKTYSARAPLRTHWRAASCSEYECDDFVHGFVLTVDIGTELGQRQAYYVRHDRSRRMHEQRLSDRIIKFVYGPGNDCFRFGEHKIPVGRPPFLLVAEGDWRGNPRGTPVRHHRNWENWVDDFASHQLQIADLFQKG